MQDELQILDEFGEVLRTYQVPLGMDQFEGVTWEEAHLYGAQLAHANFRGANQLR